MKTLRLGIFTFVTVFLIMLVSCLKEGDGTVLVHDPQIVPFITDTVRWPRDLLELFGEEHVNFGDTPPHMAFAFRVARQQYVATNLDPAESPEIGSFTPVPHRHEFRDQYIQVCRYTHGMTLGGGNTLENRIDTVYITGHDSLFTVYFHETFHTPGTPTHAVVMSGTLLGSSALIDYHYGYKIVCYADTVVPANIYPLNSIFIFQNNDTLPLVTHR